MVLSHSLLDSVVDNPQGCKSQGPRKLSLVRFYFSHMSHWETDSVYAFDSPTVFMYLWWWSCPWIISGRWMALMRYLFVLGGSWEDGGSHCVMVPPSRVLSSKWNSPITQPKAQRQHLQQNQWHRSPKSLKVLANGRSHQRPQAPLWFQHLRESTEAIWCPGDQNSRTASGCFWKRPQAALRGAGAGLRLAWGARQRCRPRELTQGRAHAGEWVLGRMGLIETKEREGPGESGEETGPGGLRKQGTRLF